MSHTVAAGPEAAPATDFRGWDFYWDNYFKRLKRLNRWRQGVFELDGIFYADPRLLVGEESSATIRPMISLEDPFMDDEWDGSEVSWTPRTSNRRGW